MVDLAAFASTTLLLLLFTASALNKPSSSSSSSSSDDDDDDDSVLCLPTDIHSLFVLLLLLLHLGSAVALGVLPVHCVGFE